MPYKSLIIISLVLFSFAFFSSCERDIPICKTISFDEKFEVIEGRSYCSNNGKSFTISRFINNYCPCDAVCIWEGELLIEMVFNSGEEFTDFTFYSSGKTVNTSPPNGWKIELAEPAGDGCTEITNAFLIVSQ